MRRILSQRRPDLAIEVVNLAFDGYDSHQLVERLRTDGLPLAPDLIIVNTGINDVRNTRFTNLADPDPRTLIWENALRWMREQEARGGPTIWTWTKHHLYVARLPGVARQHLTNARQAQQQQATSPNPEAIGRFERNLERIVDMAGAAGIAVLFSTPPSSLSLKYRPDTPPERDYWIVDAATTQRVRDELARRMQLVVDRAAGRGHQVWYVRHHLPPELFLDDCHLTADGNRALALAFVQSKAVQRALDHAKPAVLRS
jgi:lysophospholipase L1-like esterase